jgi:dynein heavy chain 2, cytosolic
MTWWKNESLFLRELLLGQLSIFIRQTQDLFMQKTGGGAKGVPKGKNLPDSVNNIVFVQQLIAKVCINIIV